MIRLRYNWNSNVRTTHKELGSTLINVITYQSKEVLNMLLNGETYTVDKDKRREINNYGPDCRNGLYPIYT